MATKRTGGGIGSGRRRKAKSARTLTKRANDELKILLRIHRPGSATRKKLHGALKEIKKGLGEISTAIHTHKL
jgi:hypothetical protein